MSERPPRPRAFRLDDARIAVDDRPAPLAPAAVIQSHHDPIPVTTAPPAIDEAELEVEAAQKSGLLARCRFNLAGVLWTGLGGLVSLAFGLWTTNLIEGLFAKAESLGLIGLAFAVLFAIGLVGLDRARGRLPSRARRRSPRCTSPSPRRAPTTTAPRRGGSSQGSSGSIAGGRRPRTPGRRSTKPPPRSSTGAISSTSPSARCSNRSTRRRRRKSPRPRRRVSVVTAISPRAVLDVIFVVAQIIRLVRRIAEIYGGRPGLLGLIKLGRSIGAHIAITGGMAVGDSLIQQLVGHGIASRISARMGEGVLNGLLTARVGLSALAVCRPAPFAVTKPPGVSDVAPFLFSGRKQ